MLNIDWSTSSIHIEAQAIGIALQELKTIVGQEHVKDAPEDLDRLGRSTLPHSVPPLAVVYPADSGEVADVVRWAGRHGIALWPCSKGRNWGYGSATPVLKGTVVLHLERLNRIVEVNRDLAYAVIEPGVTYRQLRAHLDAEYPDLWCDCTDGTPEGSVVGNALDRGLGTTHYADHFGTLCGLDVVLADGTMMQTGGGVPGCATLHTHKWGVGPYTEGLFSQSNFGIVVRAGIWLMPRPERFVSFTFDLRRADDLPALVDIVRDLCLRGVITSAVHLINDVVALAVVAQYTPAMVDAQSCLSQSDLDRMRTRYGVARWSFGGGIQGSRRQVAAIQREMRGKLAPLGRLLFVDDALVGLVLQLLEARKRPWLRAVIDRAVRAIAGKSPEMLQAAPEIHNVLKGIPSDYFVRHAYFKSRMAKPHHAHPDRDRCGIIWFAPIVPMTGSHVRKVLDLCAPEFEREGFDFYVALLIQNPRSMIVLTAIFFDMESAAQTERAESLYARLSGLVAAAGYQQYRVGTGGMGWLRDKNPEFLDFLDGVKDAVDPQGLIAPGKYGIRGGLR